MTYSATGALRSAGTVVVSSVGMAFFWNYFRYPNYLKIVYPPDAEVRLGALALPSCAAFLLALLILAVLALALWRRVAKCVSHRRVLAAAAALAGAPGGVLALACHHGLVGAVWAPVAALLVALGFLASLVLWASYFSRSFGRRELVVVSASYLLSLVAFQVHAVDDLLVQMLVVVAIPLGSGLCWLVASYARAPEPEPESARRACAKLDVRQLFAPSVWLFIAFLIAGSVVRGLVDAASDGSLTRLSLSLPIMALLVAACVGYALLVGRRGREARRVREAGADADTGASMGVDTVGKSAAGKRRSLGETGVSQFVLWCWVAFALLFFVGVLLFVLQSATGTEWNVGGNLVVIARSMLEVVFWMLLCDLANRRAINAVPLFLVCEALVETVSWALSYLVVPLILQGSAYNAVSSEYLLMVTICSLFGVVTVTCGVLLVLLGTERGGAAGFGGMPAGTGDAGELGAAPAVAASAVLAAGDTDELVIGSLERDYALTSREAQVAVHYAQGYSLAKVSEELGITKAAAQSGIRSVYRKVGVHSKDELIAVVAALRDPAEGVL